MFQEPLILFVETKNTDSFYDDQLERHLAELSSEPGLNVLLALGGSPRAPDAGSARW